MYRIFVMTVAVLCVVLFVGTKPVSAEELTPNMNIQIEIPSVVFVKRSVNDGCADGSCSILRRIVPRGTTVARVAVAPARVAVKVVQNRPRLWPRFRPVKRVRGFLGGVFRCRGGSCSR